MDILESTFFTEPYQNIAGIRKDKKTTLLFRHQLWQNKRVIFYILQPKRVHQIMFKTVSQSLGVE